MNDKRGGTEREQDRLSLSRWSRRKLEAARTQEPEKQSAPSATAAATVPSAQATPQPAVVAPQPAAVPLPPIESLTIDSDFTAFFKPNVAESAKRAALKQLFRDPRFNIMDRLDVYIDDYTQPDPIPPEMMKQLLHTRHIFDPPATEVNAEGHVVDKVMPPPVAAGAEEPVPAAAEPVAAAAANPDTPDANPPPSDVADPGAIHRT
ncbi:MAG TPA: DUF3306 domain-containing protein [Casimicrobiaceae bacterium]|jgi:hypothetical protein